jgi:hypothetical protein
MGSTPRASPQDSFAVVADVDDLPGKGAPAALLESWAGRHLGDAGEITRSNGDQVMRPHCCEAALGFHVKAKG